MDRFIVNLGDFNRALSVTYKSSRQITLDSTKDSGKKKSGIE